MALHIIVVHSKSSSKIKIWPPLLTRGAGAGGGVSVMSGQCLPYWNPEKVDNYCKYNWCCRGIYLNKQQTMITFGYYRTQINL